MKEERSHLDSVDLDPIRRLSGLLLFKLSKFLFQLNRRNHEVNIKPLSGRGFTFQSVFSLNDSVQWWRFNGLGQEVANGSKSEQFDAEGHLVQGRPEDLWSHVTLKPLKSSTAAEVKAEARPDSASAAFPLFQVGL